MAVLDIALSVCVACLVSAWAVWLVTKPFSCTPQAEAPAPQPPTALFTDDALDHGDLPDDILPRDAPLAWDGPVNWSDIGPILSERFVGVPKSLINLPEGHTRLSASAAYANDQLLIEKSGPRARVTFVSRPPSEARMESSQLLSLSSSTSIVPSWIQGSKGHILWSNAAYENLLDRIPMEKRIGPRQVFPLGTMDEGSVRRRREGVDAGPGSGVLWFDVTAKRIRHWTVCHAVDIAPVVKAEIAQRNFVQTLAKTFAHLQTGLAIFDKDRKLALFNPALVDITTLSPDFLSKQPDMFSFFDRLRESRRMPEPKDYQEWRNTIAHLSEDIDNAVYQETWSLESGQTIRVTGRPHPDKALAFLLEDISAEITLTRHFRAEMELAHAILDDLPKGLIVFAPDGGVVLCNETFREMFDFDPDTAIGNASVTDAIQRWRGQFLDDAAFRSFDQHVMAPQNRTDLQTILTHLSGRQYCVEIKPVQSGGMRLSFDCAQESEQDFSRLKEVEPSI